MNFTDQNRPKFLIVVGTFNDEYNQGFNLYQFDPGEKTIFHKN